MKTVKKTMSALAVSALVLATLVSCSKDADELTSTASDYAMEARLDDMAGFGRGHHSPGKIPLPLFDECAMDAKMEERMNIEVSGDAYPKTITLTPKETDDKKHGKMEGEVVITLSASMKEVGAVQTINANFSGDRGTRTESITITNVGSKVNGLMTYEIEGTRNMEGERGGMSATLSATVMITEGFDTDDCEDDQFQVSGSSSISGDKGEKQMELTEVVIAKSCEYPLSGVISVSGDKGSHSVNFGDGTCDALAEMTNSEGETSTIDLSVKPKHRKGRKGGGECKKD